MNGPVNRVEIPVAPSGSALERVLTFGGKQLKFEPSGRPAIDIWSPYDASRKSWRDRKSAQLEESLPQVLAGFIRIALAEKAKKEREQAEEREKQRRAEERARLQQGIKLEQSKVHALRRAAMDWTRAEPLRAFIRRMAKLSNRVRRSATG